MLNVRIGQGSFVHHRSVGINNQLIWHALSVEVGNRGLPNRSKFEHFHFYFFRR